ncbi:MAG: DUF1428 domain-containing protein [Hyphomicrobiales bacterium]
MAYVTVMVLAVPTKNLAAYKKMLKKSAAAWKRCGAEGYHEMIAADVKPGKVTSFPQAVKLKKGESVAVAYLTFKTKAQSDKAWKMMRKDPFMVNFDPKTMPFDGSRMFWGSFKTLVQF